MIRGVWRDGKAELAWPLVCALLAVAIYLPSLRASFQFDDWGVIVEDTRVRSLAAWADSMPGIRPLLKFTYALDNERGGTPAQFRAVNVVIHAINVVLVYALVYTLGSKQRRDGAFVRLAALAATLLFALHPVQTEAVTYISGRSTCLSAFFALGSLLVWANTVDAPKALPGRLWSAAFFAAALAVKETAIVVPLALLLWQSVARPLASAANGPSRLAPPWRTRLIPIAPHVALALAALLVMSTWQPYRRLLETSLQARSIGSNLLAQADAFFWFMGQLLCVAPPNPDPALPVASLQPTATWVHAALAIAAIIAALSQLRRHPALAFGGLWFFLWLLPTNSVLPRLDVANDRQLYLAIIGPAWLVGLALAHLAHPHHRVTSHARRITARVALTALIGALALLTLYQNRIYVDEVTFWEAVVKRAPASARAADNLGVAYAMACRQGDAARQFDRALRLDPSDVRARVNARLLHEGVIPGPTPPKACAQR
ncbi:MAG TPA: hypothetical protein VEE84_05955 [Burkholderiaceae bacterium]|nr:hypothetical protein [Burkholderiaceae bacterium]